MRVLLPDSSELELRDGATGLDAARAIGSQLARDAVLVRADGELRDVRLPLEAGQRITILTTRDRDDPDALATLRHSAAHLLAEAVRRLHPGVKIATGPPTETGFYYDFEFPEPISEADLAPIEEELLRGLAEGRRWDREVVTREEASRFFEEQGESYKTELVDRAEEPITLYTQRSEGRPQFTDLCRGPHLQDSKPIRAVKLTGLAGAYWRGDERNPQLTRIYGTAFYSQEDLDRYLNRLDEARRRDHRRLGPQLDLFRFSEYSPGSPIWHAKGLVIWDQLEQLRRRENERRGYLEVRTPFLFDTKLWRTSGHWDKYRDSMFVIEQSDKALGLKPMNCPGHMLVFGSRLRSYRDLPMRLAEASTLHRDELAGTLHGLLRVRHITMDDAHIFCTREQIEDEIFGCLDYAADVYGLFGMEARFELSTRPANRLGSDEEWDFTEGALSGALERRGLAYGVNHGDGAFYGPKIDLHMTDSLGRSWQMGTIQLDAQMPGRFDLSYVGADNQKHVPYLIHRALLGAFERFIGILIEHYAGAFPIWLAPVQARVIPVTEEHRAAGREIRAALAAAGFRADVDERDETVGKRIRDAELERIPKIVVYGDRESPESLAVRDRGGRRSTTSLAEVLDELAHASSVGAAESEPVH